MRARRSRRRSPRPGPSCRARRGPTPRRRGTSPENGGTDHSAGSATTTSVCERRSSARPVAAAGDARDEVRALRHCGVELARDTVRLEIVAQQLGGERLVARRVGRVEPDQAAQQVDGLVAQARGGHGQEHTSPDERPLLGRGRPAGERGRAARAAAAAAVARRVRRPGARARRGLGAPARDHRRPRPLLDLLRAAGEREDDARADRGGVDGLALRGAVGRVGDGEGRARGARRGRARRSGTSGRRTILFLDEIHRFNKAQQDALLPAVEDGLVTLIGATTENPYFEVNSALLSRCQVYELEPLAPEDVQEIVRPRRRRARRRAGRGARRARRADGAAATRARR